MRVIETPKYKNQEILFGDKKVKFDLNGRAQVEDEVADFILSSGYANVYEEGKVPRKKTKFEEALEQTNDENSKLYQAEVERLNSVIDGYKKKIEKLEQEIQSWKDVVNELQTTKETKTTLETTTGTIETVEVEKESVEAEESTDNYIKELRGKKKDELVEIAQNLGITIDPMMKKEDMISTIISNVNES